MDNYICKVATLQELIEKADDEIKRHPNNNMWVVFKERAIKNHQEGNTIMYVGILDGKIICETSAIIKEAGFAGDIEDYSGLLDKDLAYLTGFRTNKEYEGQGYFSKLYKFMEEDLKKKGYTRLCLGVEPCEVRNIQIYFKFGFTNYIKTAMEELPPKDKNSKPETAIVNFYYKNV